MQPLLHELVEGGNTMVVIEHNLEVIKTADGLIDLGPEGGTQASLRSLRTKKTGGEIVAAGTPEDVARENRSYTGAFLKGVLGRRDGGRGSKMGIQAAE